LLQPREKAVTGDVFAVYSYLLVLTEKTVRLFQELHSKKTRSSCHHDRSKEIMYKTGKKQIKGIIVRVVRQGKWVTERLPDLHPCRC